MAADATDPISHCSLGAALIDSEEHEEAVQSLRAAVELDTEYDVAWDNLGIAYHHLGRIEEAAAAYRQTIQHDYVPAFTHYGVLQLEQNHLQKAEDAFRAAARRQPVRAEHFRNLGIVLFNQEKFAEAEAALTEAITLDLFDENAPRYRDHARQRQGKP